MFYEVPDSKDSTRDCGPETPFNVISPFSGDMMVGKESCALASRESSENDTGSST